MGNDLTIYGDGFQTRNFTYITDTINATILAMKSKEATGKVINIANDYETTLNEIVGILEKISGKKARINNQAWRKGDVRRIFAETSRAKKILGFTAEVNILDGLTKTYEWNLKNPNYFNNE